MATALPHFARAALSLKQRERLIKELESHNLSFETLQMLSDTFDIRMDVLLSVYLGELQRRHLRTAKPGGNYDYLYTTWVAMPELNTVAIAHQCRLFPVFAWTRLVERLLTLKGLPIKSRPANIQRLHAMEDPIADRLLGDMVLCHQMDLCGGLHRVHERAQMGMEYELRLQEAVRALGVPFKSEKDLRDSQFAKTPDLLLEVPIAVDGHPVFWIDSKAQYAASGLSDFSEQFRGYCQRFGPGLAVLWLGCETTAPVRQCAGVHLVGEFPPRARVVGLHQLVREDDARLAAEALEGLAERTAALRRELEGERLPS